MTKKITTLTAGAILLLSLAACSNKKAAVSADGKKIEFKNPYNMAKTLNGTFTTNVKFDNLVAKNGMKGKKNAARTIASNPNTLPPLNPNSQRYSNNGLKPATGRAGSAMLTTNALMGKDRKTEITVIAGNSNQSNTGTLKKIQLKSFNDNNVVKYTKNYNNLNVSGSTTITVDDVVRGQKLQIQANIKDIDPNRTDVVTVQDTVKLRPDIKVSNLGLPAQALINAAVNVSASLSEINNDTGATVNCVLYVDGAVADRANGVWIDAAGTVACAFTLIFDAVGAKQINVVAENVVPGDADLTNNSIAGSIEIIQPVATNYYAQVHDYTFDYSYRGETYVAYGTLPATQYRDYSYSAKQKGWYQGAYSQLYTNHELSFPMSVNFTEKSGGVTIATTNISNINPDYSWNYGDGSTTYRAGCFYRHDYSTYTFINGCSYFYQAGDYSYKQTVVQNQRYAGDVVYHSSNYEHYWSQYYGYDYFYAYNYSGHALYGQRAALSGSYDFEGSVTDGSKTMAASFSVPLTPMNYNTDQPYTCGTYYYGSDYVVRSCQEYHIHYLGVQGYAYGTANQ